VIIDVRDLKKNYGEVHALRGVSFSVKEGSLFSFLGTNGAGKSTTISILTTLMGKTSGNAAIGGFDHMRQVMTYNGNREQEFRRLKQEWVVCGY